MKEKLVQFTENLINDDDLSHLTVKDLRNVLVNLQAVEENDEEEEEEDLNRYVI